MIELLQGLPQARGVTEVVLSWRADNAPAEMAATNITASKTLFICSAPIPVEAGGL